MADFWNKQQQMTSFLNYFAFKTRHLGSEPLPFIPATPRLYELNVPADVSQSQMKNAPHPTGLLELGGHRVKAFGRDTKAAVSWSAREPTSRCDMIETGLKAVRFVGQCWNHGFSSF